MHAKHARRSITFGGSGGISSAAEDWTGPTVCISLLTAHGSRPVSTVRATDTETSLTAVSIPGGARPGCSGVPQGADVPSHQLSVGRTVAGGGSDCHSQRIGENQQSHANGGLSGNPVRAEWRTPGVRAEEGHAGARRRSGLLQPTGSVPAGEWRPKHLGERSARRSQAQAHAISLRRLITLSSRDSHFSESLFRRRTSFSTNKFVAGEERRSVKD